jgi:hypothetical protein
LLRRNNGEIKDERIDTRLSAAAVALLRHRLFTKDNRVTPENKEAYRELVRAGIMFAISGFATGAEASFRLTDEGWGRREELLAGSWKDTSWR